MLKLGLGLFEYQFPLGLIMGGYAARNDPSKGQHDPISCRAFYIESESGRALLICADFVALIKSRVVALKQELAKKYQVPVSHILISVIHSHSSVLNSNLFTKPSPGVLDQIDAGMRVAAENAVKNKFDGEIALVKGDIKKVSFNRRDWDRLSDIINTETVAVKVYDATHALRGILYNYSCHPVVMGGENLILTADWPYFTQQFLRKSLKSPELFVMYLQGTPGNLNPRNVPLSGKPPINTFKDCQEIGDDVGNQLAQILNNKDTSVGERPIIKGIVHDIALAIDDEDKAEFFEEFAEVAKDQTGSVVKTVVQAIRIGSWALICLPGEMFSELGLNIKKGSPATMPFSMVVGYANDYIGYAGSAAVYRAGGYEMTMMSLSEDEGPSLEAAARDLLHQI